MKKLKIFDYVLIFICACVAALSLVFALQNKGNGTKLIVNSPYGEWIYSLDEDQKLDFESVIGITYISIENEQAFFVQSPCDNQTCILSYPVKKNTDWAACLPNQIFLRVEGNDDDTPEQRPVETLDAIGF